MKHSPRNRFRESFKATSFAGLHAQSNVTTLDVPIRKRGVLSVTVGTEELNPVVFLLKEIC